MGGGLLVLFVLFVLTFGRVLRDTDRRVQKLAALAPPWKPQGVDCRRCNVSIGSGLVVDEGTEFSVRRFSNVYADMARKGYKKLGWFVHHMMVPWGVGRDRPSHHYLEMLTRDNSGPCVMTMGLSNEGRGDQQPGEEAGLVSPDFLERKFGTELRMAMDMHMPRATANERKAYEKAVKALDKHLSPISKGGEECYFPNGETKHVYYRGKQVGKKMRSCCTATCRGLRPWKGQLSKAQATIVKYFLDNRKENFHVDSKTGNQIKYHRAPIPYHFTLVCDAVTPPIMKLVMKTKKGGTNCQEFIQRFYYRPDEVLCDIYHKYNYPTVRPEGCPEKPADVTHEDGRVGDTDICTSCPLKDGATDDPLVRDAEYDACVLDTALMEEISTPIVEPEGLITCPLPSRQVSVESVYDKPVFVDTPPREVSGASLNDAPNFVIVGPPSRSDSKESTYDELVIVTNNNVGYDWYDPESINVGDEWYDSEGQPDKIAQVTFAI